MVKKFISGLLKKTGKEEAKETKEQEYVPDELPPLAEDVVEKVEGPEEKPEESKEVQEAFDKEEEPPEDLHSLDFEEDQDIMEGLEEDKKKGESHWFGLRDIREKKNYCS